MSLGRRCEGRNFTPASVCEEDVDVTVLLFHDGTEAVQIIQARYVTCDRRDVSPDRGCGLFQLFLPSDRAKSASASTISAHDPLSSAAGVFESVFAIFLLPWGN
jgi:hypothetical protein